MFCQTTCSLFDLSVLIFIVSCVSNLKKKILQLFLRQILDSCSNVLHVNDTLFTPPINVRESLTLWKGSYYRWLFLSPHTQIDEPPVYGQKGLSFIDYMGPGVISRWVSCVPVFPTDSLLASWLLTVMVIDWQCVYAFHPIIELFCSLSACSLTFGISIALSAVVLIVERNEGLIDRTWVAGVNVPEIILSQVITQFCILLVQITLLVTVVVFGFKVSIIIMCI